MNFIASHSREDTDDDGPKGASGGLIGPAILPTYVKHAMTNVYTDDVGEDTKVGAFVEIQAGAKIGARCKIGSHSFVCAGVTIEDEVFIGHGVMFCNDRWPRATGVGGTMVTDEWLMEPVLVRRGASIGSGAVILPGVEIGVFAKVGAGAVVTKNVVDGMCVAGNPARPTHRLRGEAR